MRRFFVLLATILTGISLAASAAPQMSPVDTFLVDMHGKVAGVVEVLDVADDWIVAAEDGDHLPIMRARCKMLEPISGAESWPTGTTEEVLHVHISPLLMEMPAPAVVVGQHYILWADPVDEQGLLHTKPAKWFARPRGFLLVHGGTPSDQWYGFDGRRYSLSATKTFVQQGTIVPLDRIDDPITRLKVAREAIDAGAINRILR